MKKFVNEMFVLKIRIKNVISHSCLCHDTDKSSKQLGRSFYYYANKLIDNTFNYLEFSNFRF